MIRPGMEAYILPNQTRFRSFTDVGCYPIFYIDEEDDVRCAECADVTIHDDDEPQIVAAKVNWEDPALHCVCGERIESAYEDEDEDDES